MSRNKSTVPKNGHACKALHPLPATASAEAEQPLKLKEEQPNGKSQSSSLSSILGVTTTPKEKGKTGVKLPSRENDPKVNACSESGAEDTIYTHDAKVFAKKNKAGEGCDEQEQQR